MAFPTTSSKCAQLQSDLYLISNIQVTKKERPEQLQTVTITPSENTHFRVILSSEAMENDMEMESAKADDASSMCAIVKPEPRTPVTTVTPGSPIPSMGPLTPTGPLDVPPSDVTTSIPSNIQQSDSPSKKKGACQLSQPSA